MNITNSILRYVNNLHEQFSEKLDRAVREDTSKEYIQILSELISFIVILRKFLNNASMLDNLYTDVKSGRVCFQWLYTEDNDFVSLVRFDPRINISYNNNRIYIGFNNKGINIYANVIEYYINSLKEAIDLNDINSLISRKSLIFNILGTLKAELQHFEEDFIKCAKMVKVR
uniref:Uncharacterized protein n=1 Tax=Ignisphaera aggregans TaxID=334771 RepID=A0A7J3QG88_9CREN